MWGKICWQSRRCCCSWFSQDLWVLHVSICITPGTIWTFDPLICAYMTGNPWYWVGDHPGEGSMDPCKQGLVTPQAEPMCITVAGTQWLGLVLRRWQRKALLCAKLYHVLITNQGSATLSLTLNQEGSIKQLCACLLWHITRGVSELKVCGTSESSHQYTDSALLDVPSCTSYLRFNWDVWQFERQRCLHQCTAECNIDRVLGVCWSVRNRFLFSWHLSP
jgi:hypothetical protein